MPLYEYYCEPCDGGFELLRPVREASLAQPCPACDEDAKRAVSHEWAAFIFREGLARRLPDDGTYRHLGKKVSSPIKGPSDGYSHPELNPPDRKIAPTSLEEIEIYEYNEDRRREIKSDVYSNNIDTQYEQKKREFANRMRKTRGSKKVEDAKQRLVKRERSENRRVSEQQAHMAEALRAQRKNKRSSD